MDTPPPPETAPPPVPMQPSAPPQKGGGMKKGVIAGAVVIGVLAAGYLAWAYLTDSAPFAPAGPLASESPSPSSSPDVTAGWKTYTNSQYGFEFQYPSSWTLAANNEAWGTFGTAVARLASPELIDALKDCGVPCEASPYNLSVIVSTQSNWTLDAYADQQVAKRELSGKTATTVAGKPAYEGIEEGLSTYYVVFTENNGKIYKLYFDNTVSKSSLTAGESQILSTFQFLDTKPEGWKPFTNTLGGYNYLYPPNWNSFANQYNPTFSLFGPGATSAVGEGGVEMIDYPGTIEEYIAGIEATLISSSATTIDGIPAVRASFESHIGPMTAYYLKKDGTIVSIYLHSGDPAHIEFLDGLVTAFKFTE